MHHGAPSEPDELRSGSSPWPPGDFPSRPRLPQNTKVDIAIIGAGITGAMCADVLARPGRSLILLDRSGPASGSTAASTAMLLAELDLPLFQLADRIGFEKAADAWRRSAAALGGLGDLIAARAIGCSFSPRATLLLAGPDAESPRRLLAEAEARRAAGLPAAYLDAAQLVAEHGLRRQAALHAPRAAQADPVALTAALIRSAVGRGADLVAGEARAYHPHGAGIAVELRDGTVVDAAHVVLATGYDLPDFVRPPVHSVTATWCVSTVVQPAGGPWPGGTLLWEDADPYLYARTTPDGRIMVGGEDAPLPSAEAREAVTAAKAEALLGKLAALRPEALAVAERTWSAEFGTTGDGLPLIGAVPGMPRLLAAFGFGGNGITFSFMAAHVLAALIDGETRPWFGAFALDRS